MDSSIAASGGSSTLHEMSNAAHDAAFARTARMTGSHYKRRTGSFVVEKRIRATTIGG
jgi:hypothetical protein